ncbi:MAG: hypothetical protein ABIP13_01715 [Tepidiformaceae bacterium]
MSWITRKSFGLVLASSLALAAVTGGSLGIAFAKHSSTVTGVCSGGAPGCNVNFVGAIGAGDVTPLQFTKCLPAGSWEAIYIWDGPNQEWQHFFNPSVPAYVNQPAAGGITSIPRFAGVVLIMKLGQPAQSVTLLDGNSESCS